MLFGALLTLECALKLDLLQVARKSGCVEKPCLSRETPNRDSKTLQQPLLLFVHSGVGEWPMGLSRLLLQ